MESPTPGLVLVLDLSASLYLGILDSGHRLLAHRIREQGTRGETAHDLLDECLMEAGAKPQDLHFLCIGTGPGSFTGIRVGVAMAQGLGFAKQLPLFPFSSLAAMAVSAEARRDEAKYEPTDQSHSPDPSSGTPNLMSSLTTAIGANAGQYFTRFGRPAQEKLLSGEALLALAPSTSILVTSGKTGPVSGFREGASGLKENFSQLLRMEEMIDFPSIATMARSRAPILDGSIRPNYLQASAAEDKRRARQDEG